ncbi:MAG: DUF4268 domain-containing protein, partial [Anaerolineales bacterium]|nr:DUF4268 domain-containing protein [Anaerolineales bacterium]
NFRHDDDIFELLDAMSSEYSVLIVDGDQKLTGIVTSYDTTEYFRQRAEDLMLVEDIETMLREYIGLAFMDGNGAPDETALDEEAFRITDTGRRLRKQFEGALRHYLASKAESRTNASVDDELSQEVFQRHFGNSGKPKPFRKLSLHDYMEMFLHNDRWPRYAPIVTMDAGAIRRLLHQVREIRNALAHFDGEITAEQREKLHFCAEWLSRFNTPLERHFSGQADDIDELPVTQTPDIVTTPTDVLPVEEELGPQASKYAPLALWLQSQPPKTERIKVPFNRVEEIIGSSLPRSAYVHRAWWANDPVGHAHSILWLDAGWRVASVNMTQSFVTFARVQERQRAYIEFYSVLVGELSKHEAFRDLVPAPAGVNWYTLKNFQNDGRGLASLNFSFGMNDVFRIELYIDSGEQKYNKALYDQIAAQKDALEAAIGYPLSWQRLDDRRASRIAIILEGQAITNDDKKLARLREEAIKAVTAFAQPMGEAILKASDRIDSG